MPSIRHRTFLRTRLLTLVLGSALIAAMFALSGCATTGNTVETASNPDPWEKYNRKVFKFNKKLDDAILKPVAKGYQAITPDFIEKGVTNVFSNLFDVGAALNNLLQGKPKRAGNDAARFVVNSTLGVLGLFDVASKTGLTKHEEDFGQTLAVWGVKSGPYLMLPFLGPSTLRDTPGRVVDYYTYPLTYLEHDLTRWELTGLYYIDQRSQILYAEEAVGTSFYDPYAVLRDAYLQRRKLLIADGKQENKQSEDDALIKELEDLD